MTHVLSQKKVCSHITAFFFVYMKLGQLFWLKIQVTSRHSIHSIKDYQKHAAPYTHICQLKQLEFGGFFRAENLLFYIIFCGTDYLLFFQCGLLYDAVGISDYIK
jgi:uncharacterized membrane protein YedE/YeeE